MKNFRLQYTLWEEMPAEVQALRIYITPQAKQVTAPPASPYASVNADLPPRIVGDMRNYLALYGIDLPEIRVIGAFSPKIIFVSWDE